jgi:flagellar hook-length control protein FliK
VDWWGGKKLEDKLNELEGELNAQGMIIINVSLSVSDSGDQYCVIQYGLKSV